eukprot:Seg1616.4 transcript_id=Seg1616.4/GoldUCD/mRNA.D3Y31 product=Hemicentin-2 protein_id=Seg1616.4/GoldUCD/D3Y31
MCNFQIFGSFLDSSPLEVFAQDSLVNERETAQLTCTSKPNLFSKLTWTKDGQNISNRFSVRIEKSNSYPTKSVLTISRTTLKDSGNYTCLGEAVRGDVRRVSLIFTVKAVFRPIVQLKAGSYIQGQTVKLHCNVTANPVAHISWYKDGRRISVENTTLINDEKQCSSSINGYYFKLKNGHRSLSDLIICEVDVKKNNGTYSCMATNKLGSTPATDALNIYAKPTITANDTIMVKIGDAVNQICRADGNPKPKVYWRQISSGDHTSKMKSGSR